MTREEAKKALEEGKRIRTTQMKPGTYYVLATVEGMRCIFYIDSNDVGLYVQPPFDIWNDGWELYEPAPEKQILDVRCENCALGGKGLDKSNNIRCRRSYNGFVVKPDYWCDFFWPSDKRFWRCETCRFCTTERPSTHSYQPKEGKSFCVKDYHAQVKAPTDRCGQWKCRIPEERCADEHGGERSE